MRSITWIIIAVVGIVFLLIVGILAGHVGGIAIRKQGTASTLSLAVSEPALRGVPVVVHWNRSEWPAEVVNVTFDWRDSADEWQIGTAALSDAEARVTFPCAASAAAGSLVVRSAETGKVLLSQPVSLQAAGPECIN